MALTFWPPRCTGLTPCDFFLWKSMKGRVFFPQLPVSLNGLKERITTAVASVDKDTFMSVRTELDYRIDIIYNNKPTRCNFGSIVFIKNYKYAVHVSDALCVHLQEHYKP